MTTTLPLFWHLSSATKRERIDASVKLVSALEQLQEKFVPKELISSGSDAEQDGEAAAQKKDLLDVLNAQDMSYSIKRLVRGLASPRESSRLGFAVALTELLSRITTVTCAQIVNLIMDGTKIQGSMSGQEERDMLFGRLFGFTAVIQSGLLVRAGTLPISPSAVAHVSSLSSFQQVIKELFIIGEKKSWLRESSWWTISLALNAVYNSNVAWKSEAISFLLQHLFVDCQTWSPEKVALALNLQEKDPTHEWGQYLCPPFKDPSLLHSANLQALARILKESSTYDDENEDMTTVSSSSWKPDLHYVWDAILGHYLPLSTSQVSDNNFQEFYRIAVDESLFSHTSSAKRKYWGFQVFKKALPRATQTTMPMLFTKNFMRCWINHLSDQDRYLHKIARQLVQDVQSFVQQNPQLGFSLILQLMGTHGHQQFDKLTKTKAVESILTAMDESSIKNYIDYLYSQFDDPEWTEGSDTAAVASRRRWIFDQLGALIRPQVPKSDEWTISVLDWLIVHGLFVVKKKSSRSRVCALHSIPRPPLSEELYRISCSRLLTSLGDLSSQLTMVKMGEKAVRVAAVASDGELWTSKVLKTIDKLEADAKHVTLRVQPSPEVRELQVKAREILLRLQEVKTDGAAQGAELLLLAILLQSYCEGSTEVEELEACIGAVRGLFPSRKGTKKSRTENEETPEPIDVLVDLIIGFMERSTAYLRAIGNQAFALLSGSVKQSTIELILMQLERRDPPQLLQDSGEDESDSEVQVSGSENESEDSELSSSDEDDDPGIKLQCRVEEVVMQEDGSESDKLMNDDQMMAVDKQLADVFGSRIGVKKKRVSAQREATYFKNRVLDLVDTFTKRQPTNPLTVQFIDPLIGVLSGCGPDERQLADKIKGILRTRFGRSKDIPLNVDLDNVKSVLGSIHTQARKSRSAELLPFFSWCSIYLARIMLHCGAEDALLAFYRQSLIDFLARKNSVLNTAFFKDFIQRFASTAWPLSDDLVDLSLKAVNAYRQCQSFHLIEILLKSLPPAESSQIGIAAFMPRLSEALLSVIKNACSDETSISAAQLKELLKLALFAKNLTVRHGITNGEAWNASSWTLARTKLQASDRYKSSAALTKLCDQIIHASNSGQKSGLKRKAHTTEQVSPAPKRTKSKEQDND